MIRLLVSYIFYKTKLKTRRRYSIMEKFFLRFWFGEVLFDRAHLIIPLLGLLVSFIVAVGAYLALQQVDFTSASAGIYWKWFYFTILVFGCLGGLQLTGRTLFPEDLQILARLPLTTKQMSVVVFAEHFTTTVFNLLRFCIPIWVSLLFVTKELFSLVLILLATAIILLLAVLLLQFIGLSVRAIRIYILRRATFLKTLLFQLIIVLILAISSYILTNFLFSDINRVLNQLPSDVFRNNNPEVNAEAIATLLNALLSRWSELAHIIGVLYQYPYWPHNLSAGLLQGFSINYLKPLVLEFLLVLLPTGLLLKSFRLCFVNDLSRIMDPSKFDNILCNYPLRKGFMHSKVTIIFIKNLLLTTRHLEIIRKSLFSLTGQGSAWVILGFLAGIGRALTEMHLAIYWYVLAGVWGLIIVLIMIQLGTYDNLRFLISIDGEGRNISLLRQGGITLKDLYACQVRLLRVLNLPAQVLCVVILAIGSGFTVEYWLMSMMTTGFIFINAPKLVLLSGLAFPRFDTPHFEDSGSFFEQKVIDYSSLAVLVLLSTFALILVILFMTGLISFALLLFIIIAYFIIATGVVHYCVVNILDKLSANIKQAEAVL